MFSVPGIIVRTSMFARRSSLICKSHLKDPAVLLLFGLVIFHNESAVEVYIYVGVAVTSLGCIFFTAQNSNR
jgi:hypothetical protein